MYKLRNHPKSSGKILGLHENGYYSKSLDKQKIRQQAGTFIQKLWQVGFSLVFGYYPSSPKARFLVGWNLQMPMVVENRQIQYPLN
ncbi:MAG: hypothetical protein H6577_17375 [Lewinellaceae bacterium]|nr:hypothetical protein [Lewinellaceae bacterium]